LHEFFTRNSENFTENPQKKCFENIEKHIFFDYNYYAILLFLIHSSF